MLLEKIAQKVAVAEVIKYEPTGADANDIIVYRHETEDFGNKAHLLVAPNQVAILVNEGEMVAFPAGHHLMNESNNSWMKVCNRFTRMLSNGVSYYHCVIYFVNVVHYQDLPFGTPGPIQMMDFEQQLQVNVRANGYFGAHIDNDDNDGAGALRFFKNVVGTREAFTKKDLADYLRPKIVEKVRQLLGDAIIKREISILKVAAYTTELSEDLKGQMIPYFDEYGVKITNFSFNSINVPDEDLKALRDGLAKKKQIDLESEAMAAKRAREGYSYQQERGMDVMQAAASNEATPGVMMGAGMGLGMGFGMGGMMGNAMGGIAQNTLGGMNQQPQQQPQQAQPQQAGTKCPQCGNDVPAGMKFCPNCGNKMAVAQKCPGCGQEVPAGMKFCPNCGTKQGPAGPRHCGNCGTEIPAGMKFCPECGTKVE